MIAALLIGAAALVCVVALAATRQPEPPPPPYRIELKAEVVRVYVARPGDE